MRPVGEAFIVGAMRPVADFPEVGDPEHLRRIGVPVAWVSIRNSATANECIGPAVVVTVEVLVQLDEGLKSVAVGEVFLVDAGTGSCLEEVDIQFPEWLRPAQRSLI